MIEKYQLDEEIDIIQDKLNTIHPEPFHYRITHKKIFTAQIGCHLR